MIAMNQTVVGRLLRAEAFEAARQCAFRFKMLLERAWNEATVDALEDAGAALMDLRAETFAEIDDAVAEMGRMFELAKAEAIVNNWPFEVA
jgi:hypothetical protein